MPRKFAVLFAASAFALAACDSPADDPVDRDADAAPAEAIAAPPVTRPPEPAPAAAEPTTDAADGEALQAAYDEGKAAAAQALDDDAE